MLIPAEGDASAEATTTATQPWRFSRILLWPGVAAYIVLSASLPLTLYLTLRAAGTREHALKAATTAHAGLLLATMVLERYLRVMCKRKQLQVCARAAQTPRPAKPKPTRLAQVGFARVPSRQ